MPETGIELKVFVLLRGNRITSRSFIVGLLEKKFAAFKLICNSRLIWFFSAPSLVTFINFTLLVLAIKLLF